MYHAPAQPVSQREPCTARKHTTPCATRDAVPGRTRTHARTQPRPARISGRQHRSTAAPPPARKAAAWGWRRQPPVLSTRAPTHTRSRTRATAPPTIGGGGRRSADDYAPPGRRAGAHAHPRTHAAAPTSGTATCSTQALHKRAHRQTHGTWRIAATCSLRYPGRRAEAHAHPCTHAAAPAQQHRHQQQAATADGSRVENLRIGAARRPPAASSCCLLPACYCTDPCDCPYKKVTAKSQIPVYPIPGGGIG